VSPTGSRIRRAAPERIDEETSTVVDAEPLFRPARSTDAGAVAALHADSWRRHYRGAYADAYLDGDVRSDRMTVWKERLIAPGANPAHTLLAEHDGVVVGFIHTILDHDPTWGALVDNLHVAHGHKRGGIGAQLMKRSAEIVVSKAPGSGLYLWVLEQNHAARAFYQALGGACVERSIVPDPGGVPGRLNGTPPCLRIAWTEPRELLPA
jgi:GNAT superfamily N-acetyltransferase